MTEAVAQEQDGAVQGRREDAGLPTIGAIQDVNDLEVALPSLWQLLAAAGTLAFLCVDRQGRFFRRPKRHHDPTMRLGFEWLDRRGSARC